MSEASLSSDGRFPFAPTGTKGRRWIAPTLALVLLTLALTVLRAEVHAFSYHDIARAVRAIPGTQLTVALLWTVVAFTVLPAYDLLALEYVGRLRRRRTDDLLDTTGATAEGVGIGRALYAGMTAYGISQTLGLPALTGSAVRYRFWTAWGLSSPEIARAASFVGVSFTLGVVLVSGLAMSLMSAFDLSALHITVQLARVFGAGLLLIILLFLAWSIRANGQPIHVPFALAKRLGTRATHWAFEVPRPALAFAQSAVAIVDWAAAAAVLWVLLPIGERPPFAAFASLFVLAQCVGIVSHVPAGLGVFESLIVLGLRPYLPVGPVLAALVTYRAAYYLLPFAGALLLLAGYEVQSRIAHARRFLSIAMNAAISLRTLAQSTASVIASLGHSLAPTAVAAAVFAAGALLLVSGATPSVRPRVTALQHLLPDGVIAISHLFGSVAGTLLLVLAWALRRRLDAAWMMTVTLLGAGVLLSLLKGIDWEEASALLAVLVTVVLFRRAFYRRAALMAEPFELGWVVAIVTVFGMTTWIGLLSFRHVDLSNELWWRLRPHADAPRFLHGMLASAVALSALAIARLLRPCRATTAYPDEAHLRRAATVAANCLDTEGYLALLGDKALLFADLSHVRVSDSAVSRDVMDGFVQYGVAGQSWISMGDPIVADASPQSATRMTDPDAAMRLCSELAWQFKSHADAQGGWPVFYQVSSDMLPLYIDLGLTFLKLGEAARVELTGFSLDGGGRKRLRRAITEVERTGARFEVIPAERVHEILPRLRAISDDWLANKSVREKGFSLGFFDDAYLRRFPVAVIRVPSAARHDHESDIVAFANLWPGGGRKELSTDLMRFTDQAPSGVMDYLFVRLMLWGKDAGYQWFNLGMAPLAGLEAQALAPLWSKAGSWLYRHGEHFYNYRGLRRYKEKFDPVWEPRYLASPGGLALPRILVNVAAIISGGLGGVIRK